MVGDSEGNNDGRLSETEMAYLMLQIINYFLIMMNVVVMGKQMVECLELMKVHLKTWRKGRGKDNLQPLKSKIHNDNWNYGHVKCDRYLFDGTKGNVVSLSLLLLGRWCNSIWINTSESIHLLDYIVCFLINRRWAYSSESEIRL